jgi:hypothetical protein
MTERARSASEQDERMQRMAVGRQAAAIHGLLRPFLDHRMQTIISLMAANYRNGNADYPFLLGSAAQLTLCLDLLAELERRVSRGNAAAKEELKDGP